MGFGSGGGISNDGIDRTGDSQSGLFDEQDDNIADDVMNKFIPNKFANKDEWPSALEEGKQGKHIPGHPNFQEGKSELTVSIDEAKKLVEKSSGTGDIKGNPATSTKEVVDFGKVIGFYIDPKTEKKVPTTMGTIHHSTKGTHIVPAAPKGGN